MREDEFDFRAGLWMIHKMTPEISGAPKLPEVSAAVGGGGGDSLSNYSCR